MNWEVAAGAASEKGDPAPHQCRALGGLPSPLWGGVGVGVARLRSGEASPHHPPPQPSPTRGEGADQIRLR